MRCTPTAITFTGTGTVIARTGDTVLDAALDHGIHLEHECGGNCTCTTCHVYAVQGGEGLSPMEEPEAYRLQFASNRRPDSRLACQALIMRGPITVAIPENSPFG